MRIDYTIHFDQPWRVGSGEAAGRHLDNLVRRDGHGLPFLPGTTVRGLAGDALEKLGTVLGLSLCRGTTDRDPTTGELGELCGVTRQGEPCARCALTGSPHHESQVVWAPARLLLAGDDGAVWEPESRAELGEAAGQVPGLLTRAHPRTSIDRRSGRAADEKLFTLEESAEGLDFAGSVESTVELPPRQLALLVAALRFVHEMGGGRRRGLGRCRIRIDSADLGPGFATWQEALASLADREAAAAAEAKARDAFPAAEEAARPQGLGPSERPPRLLQLDAVVVGEVALGGRPEAGNLISGLDFVPGSTVRGALAARWRGDRAAEAFLDAFVSGRVRFGPLHPAGTGTALPVPLSWHTCKHRPGPEDNYGHGLVDLLLDSGLEECRECGARLVPWREILGIWSSPGGVGLASRSLSRSPHNRIDAETQTVPQGALFAYEAIPEGRRLRGFVHAAGDGDLGALLAGLGLDPGEPFRLRVGRRKGALGYLECTLSPYPGDDGGIGLFPDAAKLPQGWPEGSRMRVDLLTPAIVVDTHLRYLGSLRVEDLGLRGQEWEAAFASSQILAGWNSTHRLPKGDQLAVSAGSSYLLRRPETDADRALEALCRAARDGIGLRLAEGFGALAVQEVLAEAISEDSEPARASDRQGGAR